MRLMKFGFLLVAIISFNGYAQKIANFDEEKSRFQLLSQSSENLSKTIEELVALEKQIAKNKPSSDKQASTLVSKLDVINTFETNFRNETNASIVLSSAFQLSLNTKRDVDKNYTIYMLMNICHNMPGQQLFDSRAISNQKEIEAYSAIHLDYAKKYLSTSEFSLIRTGLEQQIKLAKLSNALCKRITDEKNW